MPSAKDIVVKPISSRDANALVDKHHYSGAHCSNSQLHFGVFLDDRAEGAMSFGPPMDKSKVIGLVRDTRWSGFLELNRMAFSAALPRNSESRAIAVALRMIRKHYPHVEWVISFADATQCGDGAIYRASGFVLTGIKPNTTILEFPDGYRATSLVLTNNKRPKRREVAKRYGIKVGNDASLSPFLAAGAKRVPGYQLRYIYFLNQAAKHRLTVQEVPFSKIAEMDAGMYLGKPRAGSKANVAPPDQGGGDGVTPIPALQPSEQAG